MGDTHQLLKQFIEEHHSGGEADPLAYLERVEGRDRAVLEALLDEYLREVPRAEWDAEAYEASSLPGMVEALAASLAGSSGLWPSLLPRLRNRARIKRADLVVQLAERLGAQSKEQKVAAYYHAMESGQLPAEGVSDTVLEALGKIVGQSGEALRRAGVTVRSGTMGQGEGLAFARAARCETKSVEAAAPPLPGGVAEKDSDEVDRLFRGKPDADALPGS